MRKTKAANHMERPSRLIRVAGSQAEKALVGTDQRC